MIRVARERVDDLFGLALSEAKDPGSPLPDRYVALARRVGTRYNVRFLPELRDYYCRGCSVFWVEGRTVRTRLRGGQRVRTCLKCGRVRRVPFGPRAASRGADDEAPPPRGDFVEPAAVEEEEPAGLEEEDEV